MALIATHRKLPSADEITCEDLASAVASIVGDLVVQWGVPLEALEWRVRTWMHMPGKPSSPASGLVYALVARAEYTPPPSNRRWRPADDAA